MEHEQGWKRVRDGEKMYEEEMNGYKFSVNVFLFHFILTLWIHVCVCVRYVYVKCECFFLLLYHRIVIYRKAQTIALQLCILQTTIELKITIRVNIYEVWANALLASTFFVLSLSLCFIRSIFTCALPSSSLFFTIPEVHDAWYVQLRTTPK